MTHIPGKATACDVALQGWQARHPLGVDALQRPWAVAFSGGADSTALLLAALRAWPGRVQAFHIHHGLQTAADGFQSHCERFCEQNGVPLVVERVQATHRPGQSPEDAARQARYGALARLAQTHGAACVLVGQHAQDQVETLLLALTRGAGVAGLAGMPEVMERHGVRFGRPLLGVDGRVLRDQLDDDGIDYLTDPTNSDPRYTRNRIRAQLLPALLEAFPQSLGTFARSARLAAHAQRVLQEVAAQDLLQVGAPPRIVLLQRLSRDRQANVLRHWLRQGWQAVPSEAQLHALLDQVAACVTRGHRLHLKVAAGMVLRDGDALKYLPPATVSSM